MKFGSSAILVLVVSLFGCDSTNRHVVLTKEDLAQPSPPPTLPTIESPEDAPGRDQPHERTNVSEILQRLARESDAPMRSPVRTSNESAFPWTPSSNAHSDPRMAPSVQESSSVESTPREPAIAGLWESSACGSELRITQSSGAVRIHVVASPTVLRGSGVLIREGNVFSGYVSFVHRNDQTHAVRFARLTLEQFYGGLTATTDRIYWNRDGDETGRNPVQFTLSRIE